MKTLEMMRAEIAAIPLEGKVETVFIVLRDALLALPGNKEHVDEFYKVSQSAVAACRHLGLNPAVHEAVALQIILTLYNEIVTRAVAVELASMNDLKGIMFAAHYLGMLADLDKI